MLSIEHRCVVTGARSDSGEEGPRSRAGGSEIPPLSDPAPSLPPASLPPSSLPPASLRRPTTPFLERVLVLGDNLFATFGNVFFQIRRGVLTLETIERAGSALQRHRMIIPRGAVFGVMIVAEPGATIPTEPVRAHQRAFVAELVKHPNIRIAAVMIGEDLGASLLRSASRGVVRSNPHVRIFDRPDLACEWICKEVGISASELSGALAGARAMAEKELR